MQTNLSGKNVLVIGLGLHGGAIGTILWLAEQGAVITVTDRKTSKELAISLDQLKNIPDITYYLGGHEDIDAANYDMIIRNPAVPKTSPLLMRAQEKNIPIEMDSSLFFQYCPSKNIIGITGSKGKTTTAIAIAAVMTALNKTTVTVGIDGVSPLGELKNITEESPVIFELSSWRLEPLQERGISPHIAVVTSIYKDHLNTYTSYEEYIDTKKQIIKNQGENDIALLNADDEILRTWEKDVKGKLYWFSLQPLKENQEGIWVDGNGIFVRRPLTPALSPSNPAGKQNGRGERICAVSDIPHTSPHELRNKLSALFIALLHGATPAEVVQALATMPALKHRLQLVKTINGVAYVNDSTATMPDATIAALQSYTNKPIILILGGSDKALEFENIAHAISHTTIKHLIWLPGTATDRMKQEILPHISVPSFDASTMNEAVNIASEHATSGDIVLLSPGATSFGLFLHEFERGDAFIAEVEKL